MGLLTVGEPLSWAETARHIDAIKRMGIEQFINLWRRCRDIEIDCLKFGDELECCLVTFDDDRRVVRLRLVAEQLLPKLENYPAAGADWKPEYGSFMLEGVPYKPYDLTPRVIGRIEVDMCERRRALERFLAKESPDARMLTLTNFPRLGCNDCTLPWKPARPNESVSGSLFLADDVTLQLHPRFLTLTGNIRQRRKRKVVINVPIFRDVKTPQPFLEKFDCYEGLKEELKQELKEAARPDMIYMDAMVFGMGCSCLQVTFQAVSQMEARVLYDQLANVCPLLMAISASSPIYRGYLADVDCRWAIVSASVDDRTVDELGTIRKSRYDAITSYLTQGSQRFNDVKVEMNEKAYARLIEAGVDKLLAQHIAHLFIRDPISTFESTLPTEERWCDQLNGDFHFETIQSTNWQTLRFKPPPSHAVDQFGWRVEFRPMEVQMTDFENAALTAFVVLLTRTILTFNLNFVIPISLVEENMRRGQVRDAIGTQKFHWRVDVYTDYTPKCAVQARCNSSRSNSVNEQLSDIATDGEDSANTNTNQNNNRASTRTRKCEMPDAEIMELTIEEIIIGCDHFAGLVPLVQSYVEAVVDCDVETLCRIQGYLALIKNRAKGKLKTGAQWMRDFVLSHPDYKQDSVVSDEIQYDMLKKIVKIGNGVPCTTGGCCHVDEEVGCTLDGEEDTSFIPRCVYANRRTRAPNDVVENGTNCME